MISRRNIRVKVMQALYAVESQEELIKPGEPERLLQKHFDQTGHLLVYITYFLTELARYAEVDSRNRAAKHLPTAQDLAVNTKLAGNELIWKILEHPSWQAAVKETKPQQWLDSELVRKLYLELAEKDPYKKYIQEQSRDKKEEKAIVDLIYGELMIGNEEFISHLEETFSNWNDDGEMMILLINNFLNKPNSYNFQALLSKEKRDFGFSLLKTAIEKREHTMEYIKPKLKNWDAERIAVLDMILMRLGVCEFLYFETIPPKVTINEYIDLAKEYSTLQSGQFVNGILDNIHKELVKENKMHKVSFKPKA